MGVRDPRHSQEMVDNRQCRAPAYRHGDEELRMGAMCEMERTRGQGRAEEGGREPWLYGRCEHPDGEPAGGQARWCGQRGEREAISFMNLLKMRFVYGATVSWRSLSSTSKPHRGR
jgi:hypothetical protein